MRVICLCRREYQGSTPYSTDERNAINHGSEAERANFLKDEGILIALFVDGLIQTLLLPKKGGVIVAGWSLGNIFTVAMRASIGDLPDDSKQRLKAYTRGFIILGLSDSVDPSNTNLSYLFILRVCRSTFPSSRRS
jgi:hypothetical protein